MENKIAVELIFEKIHDLIHESSHPFLADLYESMIKLEKQQIIDACNYGIKLYINDPITADDYYSETYKPTT